MWEGKYVGICTIVSCLFILTSSNEVAPQNQDFQSTDLVQELDDRLLLISTLDGSLYAVEQQTGQVLWKSQDKPIVTVPTNTNEAILPLFLPDPRDGSLYLLSPTREPLKKLPFTIPQLVASSPCRSSDGILYTGKKKDTWFSLEPRSGKKRQILGFEPVGPTCPVNDPGIYIGRTHYTIMMVDSKDTRLKWNITFNVYASSPMSKEDLSNYQLIHFASSSTGRLVTLDRRRGSMLWDSDFGSPIVAVYLLDPEGLLDAPVTSLANHTLTYLAAQALTQIQPNLTPYSTIYVGEHDHGLYAIPSLVDLNMVSVTPAKGGPLQLHGPLAPEPCTPVPQTKLVFYTGHYDVPNYSIHRLQLSGHTLRMPLITDENVLRHNLKTNIDNKPHEAAAEAADKAATVSTASYYQAAKQWLNQQENKGLKLSLIVLVGCVFAMFFYLQAQVRELSLSSNSRLQIPQSQRTFVEDLPGGAVRIGKITFYPEQILGKGCEGTVVFRGEFESRPVAVKRVLPECFMLADREVALLRESDVHLHVVRLHCTEEDRMFRYIALELCSATVAEYVQGRIERVLQPLELLRQATTGLAHLHSLDIVHRDIKPHNVLLSSPDANGQVRAMISDFGLCKKLQIGRGSFSRRSGLAGTDGWIAPEMLNNTERTTRAVDIFSLGCLFYYVLSDGKHPFGEPLHRQANILDGKYKLNDMKGDSWIVEVAYPILKALINSDPNQRPPAVTVLKSPIFWDLERILSFLQDVSDRVEKEDLNDPVLLTLERNALPVIRTDWHIHIHEEVAKDLRKYRTYRGDSIRDLLRALRNKKHHYRELTLEAQRALGEIPREFTKYWTSKFPLLLVHSWLAMQCVKKEPNFRQYYDEEYVFCKTSYLGANSTHLANGFERVGLYRLSTDVDQEQKNVEELNPRIKYLKGADKNKRYKRRGPKKVEEPMQWSLPEK